ncbi:efflux RND transporter periplasmic adaptor subunit [Azonexus fungiphilus]|uniref:efflux RND transporter periplasmic adaptor subunit n=1 Tax=Azonexus fungiphilus TaxID=146940 RepID=UPI00156B0698|nr:efflux RND transporter periplasmic adaptor subunit [Azonexus fungiphilus]NHC08409.1 efflux RND transporter periplasmic adaptor subunit [Azonexus fungiphilus]
MDKKEGRGGPGNFAQRALSRFSPPVLGLLVVLAALALGLAAWSLSRGGKDGKELIGVEVRKGDIEDLVAATGALQPRDYVDVGAQVSGQLKMIHVEVGQSVKEGDLLAEIDAEQSAARVDASLAQMRSLEAQLEQKRLNLAKAERDLARYRNLLAAEATTLESVQNAETEAANMRAQMAQLRAQIDQLRASTRVEEANLKYTRIYAPMAGTVVSIAAKKGQTLNTNQQAPTLMRVADLSVMNVQTQVSEADVAKLRVGMDAYFTTLGGQGRRWYGKLTKIEPTPTVTNNVVLYNALFEVPNDSGSLMTQMTAQVFFVVAQVHDVLVIPMSALNQVPGQRRAAGAGPENRNNRPAGEAERPAGQPEGEARRNRRESAVAAGEGSEGRRGERQPGAEGESRRAPREGGAAGEGGEARGQRRAQAEAERPAGQPEGEGRRNRREAVPGEAGDAPRGPRRNGAGAAAAETRQREARVKVMLPDGSIEERKIVVGVSNRIHAQVISGLEAGDKVVAGVREPEKARNGDASRQPQSAMQQQMPPGMPGGAAPRGR